MGLFSWFSSKQPASASRGGSLGGWRSIEDWFGLGAKSKAGENVTAESALRVAAMYACVRVLSETLATLPLHLMERQPDGVKRKAETHPLYYVLHDQPNQWQTRFEFIEMMMGHLALRQNAYARIVPGPRGAVTELIPMHPGRMEVERLENGRLRYLYRLPTGKKVPYTQDEIFHVHGLSMDGLTGIDPISLAKEPLGMSLANEAYAARFFSNNAKPGGILQTDEVLDDNARNNLKATWQAAHTGENAHKVAVLENGLKWQQVGMTNQDAQQLENRKFGIEEIARVMRVPLHMIGHLDRMTNNNIEQLSLEFLTYTMSPWIIRWEQAIQRDLISEPEKYFARFNVNALLRADSTTRAQFYKDMSSIAVLSPNDIRDLEDMNPIEGGDRYFIAANNMVPLDMINQFHATMSAPNQPPPVIESPPKEDEAQQGDMEDQLQEASRTIALRDAELVAAAREIGGMRGQYDAMQVVYQNAVQSAQSSTEELVRMRNAIDAMDKEIARLDEHAKTLEGERDALRTTAGTYESLASKYTDSMEAVRGYIQQLIADEAKKKVRWEIDAIKRAVNKPNFVSVIDQFYTEHEERIAGDLALSVATYETIDGAKIDLPAIAKAYCDQSRGAVLDASECSPEVLPEAINELVGCWEDRAAFFVEALNTYKLSTTPEGENHV